MPPSVFLPCGAMWEFDWVQWAGSIQHPLARNIGQVIGVNAGLFSWARPGIATPSDKNKLFHSSVDVTSLTTLENLARRLPPPQWPSVLPPINRQLATRGKDLYHGNKAKGIPNLCAHCHVPAKIPNASGNGPSLAITMVPLQEIGTDSSTWRISRNGPSTQVSWDSDAFPRGKPRNTSRAS